MLSALDVLSRVGIVNRASAKATPRDQVRRILVIEPKNIGDVVLALPFLAQLRRLFPNARTTLLANRFARDVFKGTDLVDEFIDTNLGWSEAATRYNPLAYNWRELWRLKRDLPPRDFDLAFKACMHIREHLVIGLSGAHRREAFAFGRGDDVLTDPIFVDDPNRPKYEDWLRLLDRFGGPLPIDQPHLRVDESERRWADEFLRECGLSRESVLIGVHPGASVPEKRWPLDRFVDVARSLSARSETQVIAFIDPQDYGSQLAEIPGVIAAKVDLRQLIALIERCKLLVCNDSGPMHIAGALGVRTVAIFGTGINLWFAPLGQGHRLITVGAGNGVEGISPYDVANIPTTRVLAEIDLALGSQA